MERTIYIFLDIDGVLNNESYFEYNYERYKLGLTDNILSVIDEQKLIILKDLCKKIKDANCNFKIILSSTWRTSESLINTINDRLFKYGLKIDDVTKILSIQRGYEIEEYCIRINIPKEDIIILDDGSDMDKYSDRLIQTYCRDGLTYTDTEKALVLLGLSDYVWKPERFYKKEK